MSKKVEQAITAAEERIMATAGIEQAGEVSDCIRVFMEAGRRSDIASGPDQRCPDLSKDNLKMSNR